MNRKRIGSVSEGLVLAALCSVARSRSGPDNLTGGTIRFADVAGTAGVRFVVEDAAQGEKFQIETMIAGVALLDYDNDGLLDVFFCNGASIPEFDKQAPKYWNRLYRNQGGLRFEDVTLSAGLAGAGYSMGAAAADYDNDGWTDLYVTGVDRNILYHNRGDGTFEDVTAEAGVEGILSGYGKAWSVGAAWLDYDLDGYLDLFVINYCRWSFDREPRCGASAPGYRTYCHPRMYAPLPNILYRNEGGSRFVDVSAQTGISSYVGKGMGVSPFDFDLDGDVDLFVSNDAWRNFLFKNQGGTFEEIALVAGVAYIDSGREVSGMGADSGDYDGDGLPDIFMTALSNETFPLFRNLGGGLFRDERFSSGLGVLSLPYAGWSLGMVDLDNDGDIDLFVAGGHVQDNEELYSGRASRQTNRVFENMGEGRFRDATPECGPDFAQLGLHRGAAFGDLDNDGRVDAVITRLDGPAEVFHNRTLDAGFSLTVLLEGRKANRDGLGARLTLNLPDGRRLVREAKTAVGYGGSSDKRVHFGLGRTPVAEQLEVRWPGGHVQTVPTPRAGFILIREEASNREAGNVERRTDCSTSPPFRRSSG
jgi:hypothetical protein